MFSSVFLLFNEISVSDIRNKAGMLFNTMHVIGSVVGTYCTYYFNHYRLIVSIYFTLYVILLVFILCFVPKSPYYLLRSKKYDDLRSCITRMSKTNKLTAEKEELVLEKIEILIKSIYYFINKKITKNL